MSCNYLFEGKLYRDILKLHAFAANTFCTFVLFQGAFWGMVVGLLVGFIRVVLHWAYTMPVCGQPDPRPAILADVHFMYFAIISTTCSAIVTVLVSLFTEPRSPEQVTYCLTVIFHRHLISLFSRSQR